MKDKIIGGIIGVTLAGAGALAITPTDAQETFEISDRAVINGRVNKDEILVKIVTPKNEIIEQTVSASFIKSQIEENNKRIAVLQAENAVLQSQLQSVYEVVNSELDNGQRNEK